jgi:hypothetical protein
MREVALTCSLFFAVACGGEVSRESGTGGAGSGADAESPGAGGTRSGADAESPGAVCRQFISDLGVPAQSEFVDCVCGKCAEAVALCARVDRCIQICANECRPSDAAAAVASECVTRECAGLHP